MPVPPPHDPARHVGQLGLTALLGGLAGLATLMRSGREVSARAVLTASLYSALISLVLALLLFDKYADNPYFLVGLCTLAGFGAYSLTDLIRDVFRAGGVVIKFGKDGEKPAVKLEKLDG